MSCHQIDTALESLAASLAEDSGLEEQRPHLFSSLVTLLGQVLEDDEMDDIWDTYNTKEGYRQVSVRFTLVVSYVTKEYAIVILTSQAQFNDSQKKMQIERKRYRYTAFVFVFLLTVCHYPSWTQGHVRLETVFEVIADQGISF